MIKNVIIVCDYGYIEGGASKVAQKTASVLKEKGLNVFLFCAVGPVSNELNQSGINVICLEQDDILHERNKLKGVLRGISNKAAKIEFKKLLSAFDASDTIIHVHTWTKGVSSSIFKTAEKEGFKVVITVHDYFLICPNGGLFNYPQKKICELKPMSLKCLLCNCDARSYPQKVFRVLRQSKQNKNIRERKNISYIFISEFSKRQFFKRYNKIPKEKQYFLTNIVDFEKERNRVECEKNNAYLFIGGVTEVKGIRMFCTAVSKSGVKAVVIGAGILKEELEKQYPEIKFVGWKSKEEIKPYIERARCLVFSSIWYEVSPLTPLETLAYGVPVICSDLNATSELIEHRKSGLIYHGNSVEDLSAAIEESKDDELIKNLSEYAFSHFEEEKYSAEKYVSDLLKIYGEINGKKNKKACN